MLRSRKPDELRVGHPCRPSRGQRRTVSPQRTAPRLHLRIAALAGGLAYSQPGASQRLQLQLRQYDRRVLTSRYRCQHLRRCVPESSTHVGGEDGEGPQLINNGRARDEADSWPEPPNPPPPADLADFGRATVPPPGRAPSLLVTKTHCKPGISPGNFRRPERDLVLGEIHETATATGRGSPALLRIGGAPL